MSKIKSVLKSKKFWLILGIIIILIVALILFLFFQDKEQSHNDKKQEETLSEEYITVSFDTDGGSNIDSVVIKIGETIKEPDIPTKDGYTFKGWYIEEEEFAFSKPITEEITLKAKWEENKEEKETPSTNSNSHNSPNKNSTNNSSNNNTSSTSRINLNNNISVTEYHVNDGTIDCFYYMFLTNLPEIFPEAKISKINNNPATVDFWHTKQDRQSYEVSTEEINEYLASGALKINTSAENNFKNILNKYKNGNYKGIANVSYTESNHRFTFTYDYISFNGLNVSSNGETANKEIQNALSNSTKFVGPCGSASGYKNQILNEELCSKYHLDCGRW